MNKTLNKVKWIALIAALLILTVFVIAANTNGFTTADPYGWFSKQEETAAVMPTNETEENNVQLKIYNSPLMRLSANVMSAPLRTVESTGITLTATILPETATNKEVDWTVQFSDPSNAWAAGKNASDYVAVTPTSDGALTASVSAKRSFASQIKIVVTSRANAEATAYCIVEYGQRLSSDATLEFVNNMFATNGALTNSGVQSIEAIRVSNWQAMTAAYSSTYTYEPTYATDYTLANENVSTTFSVKASDSLYNALKAKGIARSSNSWVTLDTPAIGKIYEALCTVQLIPLNGTSTAPITNVNNFNDAIMAASGNYDLELKIAVATSYETKEYVIQCHVNRNGPAFAAKSVSLSSSSIVL